MKKILLFVLTILTVMLTGCGQKEKGVEQKVLGFAQESNSHPFRIAETDSLREYAEKNGFKFVFTDAEGDLAKQVANMESLIAQQVDYIAIAPRESEGFEEVFQNAKEAGIPVILIDRRTSGVPGEDYTTVITSDFVWEGEQAAKWLLDNNDANVNIVELSGIPGASVTQDRHDGFMNIVNKSERLNIIASQVAEFHRSTGQKVMANILQSKGNEINAVYAHNDEMALGAVAAIKEAGLVPGKDIQIIGIDGQKEAAAAIKAGEMNVTITCDPHFGEEVFENIAKLEAGEKVEAVQVVIDKVYDQTNINDYKNPF